MTLYPYQEEGVAFLTQQLRAYLADGMGLGKTVQALTAAHRLGLTRILVVCPASAVLNWQREAEIWAPGALVGVLSYASPKLQSVAKGSDWDVVILDEAHYVKSVSARRTVNALRVARSAPRAWLLSGTPMPNHPGELWPPLRALWPERVPVGVKTYSQWFDYFCSWTLTKYGKRPYAIRRPEELRAILKGVMIHRTAEEVDLQLPPLRVDVSLLPKDARFAEALQALQIDPEGLEARMAREDQDEGSGARLRRLLGEYKAPHIGDLLRQELEEGQYYQVVVLAYHRAVLDVLRSKLSEYSPVGFDGSTSQVSRQRAIDHFTQGGSRVFLAQQTAAGIAINLQASSEVVLVEPSWTPDENQQAIKRIHRIGQTRPCRARIFAVAGTLDEAIMRTVANKARMQREVGL